MPQGGILCKLLAERGVIADIGGLDDRPLPTPPLKGGCDDLNGIFSLFVGYCSC